MFDGGLIILLVIVAFLAGAVAGYVLKQVFTAKKVKASESLAARIVDESKKEAETIKKEAILQAKENLLKMKADFDRETKDAKNDLEALERRIRAKEENLDKRVDTLSHKEANIEGREKGLIQKEHVLEEKNRRLDALVEEQKIKLEKIAGITPEEAKLTLGDYVAERTVSVVNLPSEEMKGRIIGREGRNIRAIEAATGIDLIVDDTPEAVVLSSFDPVRREVARISLERLIQDGRIHPGRIEDIVKKVEKEVEQTIREAGEKASFDCGVHDIHPEIINLLGTLKYRTSYSQNVLQHSIDVAYLTGLMAAELKLNIKEAKRAGLLHDIGKAVDHKIEGTHAAIGADFARRFGENQRIVQAIATHHDDGRSNTLLGVLVQAADTLSAARPGARREMLESYVQRLEELEKIANSFTGVDKSFAIQAGREIRIMVENEKISDNDAVMLCNDIVKKIEDELTYPGQIKVTVIRETRVSNFAK